MSNRKDFSKEARKSKPFTVRFPQSFVGEMEKERKIMKGQDIADFLVKLYDQTFHLIVGNPVIERNTPMGRMGILNLRPEGGVEKEVPQNVSRGTLPVKPEKKRGLSDKFANAKLSIETEEVQKVVVKGEKLTPPAHLKGIDLTIWKRENGVK
jgi:hypothetical protein